MNKKLKIFNVYWSSDTAGVSPDNNNRTEIFLAGCKKAIEGNPCKGCFNSDLWEDKYIAYVTAEELLKKIRKFAPNKFISFVGGEPLDQLVPLGETCELLGKNGYHITIFSHYTLEEICNMKPKQSVNKLLKWCSILIDGEYEESTRIYEKGNLGDGIYHVIGSGNQIIWDLRNKNQNIVEGFSADELTAIYVTPDYDLKYITKNEDVRVHSCNILL